MTTETLPHPHQDLISQVQHNCDISDAQHAGNFTLCIYLLKMREYYRWMQQLEYSDNLDNDGMGQWLREKEDIWDRVIDQPFKPLSINGNEFDPFDHVSINRQLQSGTLFYHAGIGHKAVQHFVLAELLEQRLEHGISIHITGREYARDLTAPPAVSTGKSMIIRRQSLTRMCWERYQEWNWSRLQNPMGKALSFYPFEQSISVALEQMVEKELDTLIQHEIGEVQISLKHGDSWKNVMSAILGTRAELLARAIRDHYADCLTTLPFLCARNDPASLNFYFANLTALRKQLFPSALTAYQRWSEQGEISILADLAQESVDHWRKSFQSVLEIGNGSTQNASDEICLALDSAIL